MSVPARRVAEPAAPSPARRPSPAPTSPAPQRRPAAGNRRRRRPANLRFASFMCLVVTVLIVGVVTLNALLAQAAFQIQAEQDQVASLQQDTVNLTEEAARLSSPVAVATWARRHDMVTPAPGEVHILRVPGSGR